MTFEERLDKISEKVDAIAHNLDVLTRMHVDNDREYQERFQANEKRLAQVMDTVERLARIAAAGR